MYDPIQWWRYKTLHCLKGKLGSIGKHPQALAIVKI